MEKSWLFFVRFILKKLAVTYPEGHKYKDIIFNWDENWREQQGPIKFALSFLHVSELIIWEEPEFPGGDEMIYCSQEGLIANKMGFSTWLQIKAKEEEQEEN